MWLGLVKNWNFCFQQGQDAISLKCVAIGREREMEKGVGTKEQYLNTEAGMWFLK